MTSTNPSPGQAPDHRRRKVRKGTQSCWECKRRKIRCTFAERPAAVCDGCLRRGTSCIGQEFPESASSSRQVSARLGRVEALIEELARKVGHDQELSPSKTDPRPHSHQNEHSSLGGRVPNETLSVIPQSCPSSPYHGLSSRLAAAWPSRHEIEALLALPDHVISRFKSSPYAPYSSISGWDTVAVQDVLQSPPLGSHPALIARQGLLLACFLQQIQAFSPGDTGGLSLHYRDTIMSDMVQVVRSMVTGNDDLMDSVEGVECLFIEGIFHNNAGNLRRSWLAVRRAMSLAQLMGLPQGASKTLRSDIRKNLDQKQLWSRLVQMNCYLSFVLGLPVNYPESDPGHSNALPTGTCLERMQHLHCVAAGRISQQSHSTVKDLASMMDTDRLLQDAASLMPPNWWILPSAGTDMNDATEITRVMNLMTHSYLLSRLHLPYFLDFAQIRQYEYSKMTALNASRDILSLFVSFRMWDLATTYCRGIDFLAFTAAMVMSIAHLEARRHNQIDHLGGGAHPSVFKHLVHQRGADRGLLERVLEIMEGTDQQTTDDVASSPARIIRRMLDVEGKAAAGEIFIITPSVKEEREHGSKLYDGGDLLLVSTPIFGTIKIERHKDFGIGPRYGRCAILQL